MKSLFTKPEQKDATKGLVKVCAGDRTDFFEYQDAADEAGKTKK